MTDSPVGSKTSLKPRHDGIVNGGAFNNACGQTPRSTKPMRKSHQSHTLTATRAVSRSLRCVESRAGSRLLLLVRADRESQITALHHRHHMPLGRTWAVGCLWRAVPERQGTSKTVHQKAAVAVVA